MSLENSGKLQLEQQQPASGVNSALKRSASVENAEKDETVIIQVRSNNTQSRELLDSVPQA